MSKMLYMLPLMFIANKINFTDELINILRVVYITVQIVSLTVAWTIQRKVRKW